jgi:hypothetical protein
MSSIKSTMIKGTSIVISMGLIWYLTRTLEALGGNSRIVSGWGLGIIICVLGLFYARRRISVIPVLPVRIWKTLHEYLGWFALTLFLLHLNARWPNGVIEISLTTLYLFVAVSGIIGQLLNYWVPMRLNELDEEFIYERIPVLIQNIRENMETSVRMAAEANQNSRLVEFYFDKLANLISRRTNIADGLFRRSRSWKTVEKDLLNLKTRLPGVEKDLAQEICTLLRKRRELELSYAYQWLAKSWLLIHVPLSFTMIVLLILHVLTIHAFRGF